jgi:MFS family permease
MNSISTYNTYLSTHRLSDYSASSIGWIFSTYIFLTFLCGIFIGPVFDARGPRLLVFAGSVLMMASVMLIGICTGMWKQLPCQS